MYDRLEEMDNKYETNLAYSEDSLIMVESGVGPIFISLARVLIRVLKPTKLNFKKLPKGKGSVKNYEANINKQQLENALNLNGLKKTVSKDGFSNIFIKGNTKISTRNNASSSGFGPTADVFRTPLTKSRAKIRLIGD